MAIFTFVAGGGASIHILSKLWLKQVAGGNFCRAVYLGDGDTQADLALAGVGRVGVHGDKGGSADCRSRSHWGGGV